MNTVYTFDYEQLFNCFGAPGIPSTYRITLYRNGKLVSQEDVFFRWRAERRIAKLVKLYGAKPL